MDRVGESFAIDWVHHHRQKKTDDCSKHFFLVICFIHIIFVILDGSHALSSSQSTEIYQQSSEIY